MKFSVILLTYEASFDKVKTSLDSIVAQKCVDFEIVIADDGSKLFPQEEIINYFGEKNFVNYKIVANEINKGTIKNSISGIEVAEGDCVKLIGAGDLLFDENAVNKMYDYLSNSEYGIAFGLMKSFYIEGNEYHYKNEIFAPKRLEPYQLRQDDKIYRNILLCRDYISGASLFGKKDFIEKYLHKISQYAVYLEDYMTLLIVLDGEKIGYLEEYIVYYELFSGISTNKESEGNKRILNDSAKAWNLIAESTSDPKVKKNILARNKANGIKNKVLRNLYRLVYCPSYFKIRNKHSVVQKDEKGFLESK